VAFFAQTPVGGHVSAVGNLAFKETVINEGNGYNSAYREFGCPQAGLYMFAWNIASHGYSARTSLFQNGLTVNVDANTDPRTATMDDSSTSFAILRLNRNDRINVHGHSGKTTSRFFAGWRIDENNREYLLFLVEGYFYFSWRVFGQFTDDANGD
jgi:hypothetical protein